MNLFDTWGEISTGILLVIGLIISWMATSLVISIIIIFICGILVGRLYHIRRHRLGAAFYFIVAGFLLGYLIGSMFKGFGVTLLRWGFHLIFFYLGCKFGDYMMHRNWSK